MPSTASAGASTSAAVVDALEPERRAGRLEHPARTSTQGSRIAVVVGPLEVEVVAQERQQHVDPARVQRRQQRQRRRLAAHADEGRDRARAEHGGMRRERGRRGRARSSSLRCARRSRSAARSAALARRTGQPPRSALLAHVRRPERGGRAEAALAAPVETTTSTTIVITYGSAWKSCGAIVDAARLERERQRRERAEHVRADEAEVGPPEREDDERDRDPARAAGEPVDPLRRDREAEARAADAGERAAASVCSVAVRA